MPKKRDHNVDKGKNVDDNDDVIPEEEAVHSGTQLKKLRERLALCEAAKQEYLDGWQRAQADMVNVRRAAEEARASAREDGITSALGTIIPALDAFNAAMRDPSWSHMDARFREGILSIHTSLLSALKSLSVEEIGEAGEGFDPNAHEAVSEVKVGDPKKDHMIAEVLQRGYIRKGRVIRPAKVSVYTLES